MKFNMNSLFRPFIAVHIFRFLTGIFFIFAAILLVSTAKGYTTYGHVWTFPAKCSTYIDLSHAIIFGFTEE